MKLWIDDMRQAPNDTWTVAKSSAEALKILADKPELDVIALDHDLGLTATFKEDNIWPVMEYLTEYKFSPVFITVHTGNPWARKELLAYCDENFPEATVVSVPMAIYLAYKEMGM